MTPTTPTAPAAASAKPDADIRSAIAWRLALMPFVMFFCLFVPAGRVDLPFHWAYLVTMVGYMTLVCLTIDPDLIRERMRPGPGGTDRNLRPLASVFFAGHIIVAGLSVRLGWGPPIDPLLQWIGLVGLIGGMSVITWAIGVNRFFSPVVRIQRERGHHLITAGPYRFVRHPGYLGTLIAFPGGGLMLGSWWALLAMLPVVLLMIRRAVREDRYLHEHLDGYGEFAGRVRWRLVPRLW